MQSTDSMEAEDEVPDPEAPDAIESVALEIETVPPAQEKSDSEAEKQDDRKIAARATKAPI